MKQTSLGGGRRAWVRTDRRRRGAGCPTRNRRSGAACESPLQNLKSGNRIDRVIVFTSDWTLVSHRLAFVGRDRSDPRRRRSDHRTLDHARRSSGLKKRHQRLALAQFRDDLRSVELGIGAERLGRRLDRLLIGGRKGAQRVLYAVAELTQYFIGNVDRILSDKINAHPFGSNQTNDLLGLVQQLFGCFVEEKMRLIEKENELRLRRIADLRQLFEQFREQPEQERGVKPRIGH